MQEDVQYLTDAVGNKKAVIVPIQEWEQLIAWYKQTEEYQKTKAELHQAFKEVEAMEQEKLAPQTLDDLKVAHES